MARPKEVGLVLRAELEKLGIPFTLDVARKHPRLLFEVAGTKLQYFYPATPSCPRSAANNLACLRRMIRQAQTKASQLVTTSHD